MVLMTCEQNKHCNQFVITKNI